MTKGHHHHSNPTTSRRHSKSDEVPIPNLSPTALFSFPEDVGCVRVTAEWTSKPHSICDLDLEIHMYDERARFMEKVDGGNMNSRDGSCQLLADLGFTHTGSFECVKIDFDRIAPTVSTILLFMDGGKNFSVVNTLGIKGIKVATDRSETSFLPSVGTQSASLFMADGRVRKESMGMGLCVLYKDGWANGKPQWILRAVMESYSDYPKGKEESLGHLIISIVPSLEKFKPRLFAHVRDISNALSSRALPKLKKSFQKNPDGLNLGEFTSVLFSQLAQTHPKVLDELEAAYAVAMIHEMFFQIDYNGDGRTDWDEFTTFCIQTGLKNKTGAPLKKGKEGDEHMLDEYVIQYGEDSLMRDRVLSSHRFTYMMKFIPDNRRLFVIPEDSDNVLVMNEKFKVLSQIYPSKIQILGSVTKTTEKPEAKSAALGALRRVCVYDIVYLTGRDLYAFCSSDHAIVVCKEQISMGGTKINYLQHNKVFHTMLHLKLCWSKTSNLLCSVASDKTIYGWDIDKQLPIFQISRHSDIITDFIAIENMEVFVTCSMDKTIVMWSAQTRRVKGVFLGHKRGVRSLSVYENIMLSSGFESEGKTWDLVSKEPLGVLRGHRHSIACSKLMCDRAESEKEYRAITVDEVGEFRLWDIYIKERTSEPAVYPTLQVFQMLNPEIPLNNIRFIALPNNPQLSTSYYSDLIAVGTKLLHFLPEKNAKDFIAPTCCCFNDPSAALVTAVGRNLVKYDITNGHFITTMIDVHTADITCMCLDGDRGRRIFAGCANGDVLLLNFMTGAIIDSIQTQSKEIVCIASNKDHEENRVYTGSIDGRLKELEETAGNLRLHNQLDLPFGDGVGISAVKIVPSLRVIVAAAIGASWGIWNESTLKRVMIVTENGLINSIEIISATRDKEDLDFWTSKMASAASDKKKPMEFQSKEQLLTLAVALPTGIKIYTIDLRDAKGVVSFELNHSVPVYFTSMSLLRSPEDGCVNYSMQRQEAYVVGMQLIAVTDDGQVVLWDANKIRRRSEYKCRRHLKEVAFAAAAAVPTTPTSSRRPKSPEDLTIIDGFDEDGNFVGLPSMPFEDSRSVKSTARINALPPLKGAEDNSAAKASFLTEAGTHGSVTKHRRGSRHGTIRRRSTSEVLDGIYKQTIPSTRSWIAHLDSIPILLPLHEHGCFVTVSLDGYHKVWNVERDCLGELPLPNLTEKLKNPPIRLAGCATWKFVLERIPVSAHHREVAALMIHNISLERAKSAKSSGHGTSHRHRSAVVSSKVMLHDLMNVDTSGLDSVDSGGGDDQSRARDKFVRSLQEPPSYLDDAPPTKVLTKDERKELAKQEALLAMSLPASFGKSSLEGASVMTDSIDASQEGSHRQGLSHSVSFQDASVMGSAANDNVSVMTEGSAGSLRSSTTMKSAASLWTTAEDFCDTSTGQISFSSFPAFSEPSLSMSCAQGHIGAEEYNMLRRVASQADKISVYDRCVPMVLLRNTKMTTSVVLPNSNSVKRSEVSFGVQKDMYKHADEYMNEKAKIPKKQIVHAIAMARIQHSVRKVHTMIHILDPKSHDDVVLPKDADIGAEEGESDKLKEEEMQMRMRLNHSAALVPPEALHNARPLDKSSIDEIIKKFDSCIGTLNPKDDSSTVSSKRSTKKKKNPVAAGIQDALEKKLCTAIKDVQKASAKYTNISTSAAAAPPPPPIVVEVGEVISVKAAPKKHLTTRALLPYYKIEDVKNFMDTFSKVDEDFSGDLDIDEWVNLFALLNENVPAQQARMIFMKVDDNGDGYISMRELVPIVFNKASKEQMKLIIAFVESELVKKNSTIAFMTPTEMDQLFECYDVGKIGFIPVSVIRERVKSMSLPESVIFDFLDSISGVEADEMVNQVEFSRMMKAYIQR